MYRDKPAAGFDNVSSALTKTELGCILRKLGRYDEALVMLREAFAVREQFDKESGNTETMRDGARRGRESVRSAGRSRQGAANARSGQAHLRARPVSSARVRCTPRLQPLQEHLLLLQGVPAGRLDAPQGFLSAKRTSPLTCIVRLTLLAWTCRDVQVNLHSSINFVLIYLLFFWQSC